MKKLSSIIVLVLVIQSAFAGIHDRYVPVMKNRLDKRMVYTYPANYPPNPHYTYSYPQPATYPPVYAPVAYGPVPMNPASFAQLKQTINCAAFESTKYDIFRQALAYNYFTSCQVSELMNVFSFEGSRLDVAKAAYPKTVDPANFYLVNNSFAFSSSVAELGEYMACR